MKLNPLPRLFFNIFVIFAIIGAKIIIFLSKNLMKKDKETEDYYHLPPIVEQSEKKNPKA